MSCGGPASRAVPFAPETHYHVSVPFDSRDDDERHVLNTVNVPLFDDAGSFEIRNAHDSATGNECMMVRAVTLTSNDLGTSTLPKTWLPARLADLGKWVGGGTPSRDNIKFWRGGTTYWVTSKDMKGFTIERSEERITRLAIRSSTTSVVRKGAVLLVVRSGILRTAARSSLTAHRSHYRARPRPSPP
jgi:hypothetical protein